MFKIDLHIHTSLGGDSLITPHDVAERAREVGLDAVCITELIVVQGQHFDHVSDGHGRQSVHARRCRGPVKIG